MNRSVESVDSVWWSIMPLCAYGLITSPGTRSPSPWAFSEGGTTWS